MNWKDWGWKRWVWPLVLILSTLAVSLAAFQNWQSPLRPLITLWFMAICPGMALLRVFGLRLAAAGWLRGLADLGAPLAGAVQKHGGRDCAAVFRALVLASGIDHFGCHHIDFHPPRAFHQTV